MGREFLTTCLSGEVGFFLSLKKKKIKNSHTLIFQGQLHFFESVSSSVKKRIIIQEGRRMSGMVANSSCFFFNNNKKVALIVIGIIVIILMRASFFSMEFLFSNISLDWLRYIQICALYPNAFTDRLSHQVTLLWLLSFRKMLFGIDASQKLKAQRGITESQSDA